MCGICVALLPNHKDAQKVRECVAASRLIHRGPDVQDSVDREVGGATCWGLFYGTTLHFRGNVTRQPLSDSHGNLLVWNGEIFAGIQVDCQENDGGVLLELLGRCRTDAETLSVLSQLRGPWAFVYYQRDRRRLWFGRDVLGRRSLLYHRPTQGGILLSSVTVKPWSPWVEVPAVGVFCVPLEPDSLSTVVNGDITPKFTLYPWAAQQEQEVSQQQQQQPQQDVSPQQPQQQVSQKQQQQQQHQSAQELHHHQPMCQIYPKGVVSQDSSDLYNKTLMSRDDLLPGANVKEGQLRIVAPISPFNACVIEEELGPAPESDLTLHALSNDQSRATSREFLGVLESAVRTRVTCQSDQCSDCIQAGLAASEGLGQVCGQSEEMNCLVPSEAGSARTCGHTRVAVLFSGGVDSLVIAALADRCLPPGEAIDLMNVGFERPQKPDGRSPQTEADYNVPDRVTGEVGLQELRAINPRRHYNFIRINVTIEELKEARRAHVAELVRPLTTVLDDSIGCAIWFAARGRGIITDSEGTDRQYTSPARIVLVGMGADEQLAGYSRHRAKFGAEGWAGLLPEIQLDIERISARNLGRDDRIISDHGREARFPFLDEGVVSFLNRLPLNHKADLRYPRGVGEKYLLRLLADSLGLTHGATAPKRAVQFGSRIAKAEDRREKGSAACERLQE